MELLSKVKEIFDNHPFSYIFTDGYKNVYNLIKAHPELAMQFKHHSLTDDVLFDKYKENIPRGWYGFSIGTPVIPVWVTILDEIVKLCIATDPNFEIHQIKMKYGGICFYCESEVITDLRDISSMISHTMYDNTLIY